MVSNELQTSLPAALSGWSWLLSESVEQITPKKSGNLEDAQLLLGVSSVIRLDEFWRQFKQNDQGQKQPALIEFEQKKKNQHSAFKQNTCNNTEISKNRSNSNRSSVKLVKLKDNKSSHVLHKRTQVITRYQINRPPSFLSMICQGIIFSTMRKTWHLQILPL